MKRKRIPDSTAFDSFAIGDVELMLSRTFKRSH